MVVYSGDGDLFAIGGNHFIHAARRNMDLKVICVNNLTYAMTGGQTGPTTPDHAIPPPRPTAFRAGLQPGALAEAAGAVYVARWTTFHVRQLSQAMEEVMKKKGFCFIEIISPCPTLYQRRNKMGDGLDPMKYYKEVSKIRNGAPTRSAASRSHGEIIVGKFVDRDRPDYFEMLTRADERDVGRPVRGTGGIMRRMLTRDPDRGVRRAGRDPGRHGDRQGGRHLRRRLRHPDPGFGPEARGGASSAQVILSSDPILYPYVSRPDILVVMCRKPTRSSRRR